MASLPKQQEAHTHLHIYNMYLSIVIAAFAAVSDVRSRKIRNRFMFICLIVAILYRSILFIEKRNKFVIVDGLIGFSIPFIFFLVPYIIHCIGAADIKLMCILGMIVGAYRILDVIVVTILLAGIYCIWLVMYGTKSKTIPFAAPIFAASIIVAIFYL